MQVQDTDPLAPPQGGDDAQPGNPPPQGFSGSDLMSGWNNWINKPNNRAALAQFGIAMLQPMGMGESAVGHFANAVGHAGEAHQRVTTEEQQAEKLRSENDTREIRARAAESSANAAENRAYYAGQNRDLQTTNNLLRQQIQAKRDYDIYSNDIDKQNSNRDLLGQPKLEKRSFEDYIKDYGLVHGDVGGRGRAAPTAPAPGVGAGATSAPADTGGASASGSKTEMVLNHPTIKGAFATVREAAASGDSKRMKQAKDYVDQQIAPYIDPGDLPRVYQMYGIH